MEQINEDIYTLKIPSNFVITGCTGCGKTSFLFTLLKNWPFNSKRGKMIYFYNIWQPLFEKFMTEFPEMVFVQGLHLDKIEDFQIETDTVNVVICDDLMDIAVKDANFAKLFTVYGHHKQILNFFLTQNPYFQGSMSTTLNRNTHYYVLMKTPHLNTISILNSQLYGGAGPLKNAYVRAMKEKKYAHLLIDVFNDSLENRLRSNIFQEDDIPLIIWRSV